MTREEAIRLLDPETTAEAIAEIEYYAGFEAKTASIQAITEACELAVNDMRKRIPQKPHPTKVTVDRLEIGNIRWNKGTTVYRCPDCNCYMSKVHKCCFKCGQAIDWEGIE